MINNLHSAKSLHITLCWIYFLLLICQYDGLNGKLVLHYFPKGTDLKVQYQVGRSLLMCRVESDRKFKLEWFKNGKLLNFEGDLQKPPLPFPFADGSGLSLVQWPYLYNFSRGVHECRASNGIDPPVSHTVNFQPFNHDPPEGFPKVNRFSVSPRAPTGTWESYYLDTNVTLTCEGTGKGNLEIRWFFNYVPLDKKPKKMTYLAAFNYWLSKDNTTLTLYDMNMNHKHENFNCFIANEVGIRLAGSHRIRTIKRPTTSAPKVVPRIVVKPQDVKVDSPEVTVEFSCKAAGSPTPVYSWQHNGEMVGIFRESGNISFVAYSSGYVTCFAINEHGKVNATAMLDVTPLPFRAPAIQVLHKTPTSFTILMRPNKKEKNLHPNIPITYVILDYRRWKVGLKEEDKFNQTTIEIKGSPPWTYKFQNLNPWTFIDVRVRFGNRNGTGRPSDWKHGHSKEGRLEGSARNLKNLALSNRSFKLSWDPPLLTRGPVKRYELHWTHAPEVKLKYWQSKAIGGDKTSFTHDWNNDEFNNDWKELVAPVIYWKVLVRGYLNAGNFSKTKVFRVSSGAPGFVTNVSGVPGRRHIHVYWNGTKDVGNGIIGHRVLYNPKNNATIEENWKYIDVWRPTLFNATIPSLIPNQAYDIKVYPRSHAMLGVPSATIECKTFMDFPSGPPNNVKAVATSSESIEVTWEPPKKDHQNGPILRYEIFYTKKLIRKPQKQIASKDARKTLLQGLGKYIQYTIWMVAVNEEGEGPPSKQISVLTNEEVPDGAPRAIRAQILNQSSIAVAWLPPLSNVQNGRIIGYKIFYDFDTVKLSDVMPLGLSEIIHGQHAKDGIIRWQQSKLWYSVSVAAFTLVGDGPKSNRIHVLTPPRRMLIGPIVQIEEYKTNNFVILKWWPRNTNIRQFKVVYGKSLRKYDMVTDKKGTLLPPDIRRKKFDDLAPGVFYSFKVFALGVDDKGWSAPGTMWIKTSDGIPSGAPLFFEGVTESASSIKLNWEQPDPWKRNGQIVSYVIRYKAVSDDVWKKQTHSLKNDEEDAVVFILSSLKSNTRYHVKVRALTRVGSGPDSEVIVVSTNKEILPVVDQLKILDVESNSTFIRWSAPKNNSRFEDHAKRYVLTYYSSKKYRNEFGQMKEFTVNKSVTTFSKQYLLEGLNSGTTYNVEVRVLVDEAGLGDPVTTKVTTRSSGPPSMVAPIVVRKSIGKLLIKLDAASEINGKIHHYLLIMIDFGVAKNRQRREVDLVNTTLLDRLSHSHKLLQYFNRTALPTVFNLRDKIIEEQLQDGNSYIFFTRAAVRKAFNQYGYTDSPYSESIVYEELNDVLNSKQMTNTDGANEMILIIACLVGSVMIIFSTAIIFVCRRRQNSSRTEERSLLNNREQTTRRSKKFSSDPTEIHRMTYNTPGMLSHPPIHVRGLYQHVEELRSNGGIMFLKEFESIDEGEKPPSEAATLLQNSTKNRYPNVLAFDHTRVKLEYTGVLCSDYINANYVDGYCKEKAYIATQGPTKNTVVDFWRLCWEQNVQIIVMMTNVEERHKNKCEKYWPDNGAQLHGSVKVELKEQRKLCNYSTRVFEVTSNVNGETRIIKQFQYLQWPDPGVPLHAGPVLAFVRRVRSFNPPGMGPVLVHCSAGVGRTACFITIDAMLERLKYDNYIDIYGYVTMIRSQRNFMVQTDEQYVFVHQVLVEAIQSGDTEISSGVFGVELRRLTELHSNETLLELQFKKVNQTNIDLDPSLSLIANNNVNESKNRNQTIVPFDSNRVPLQLLRSHEGSNYINATFIDGCHKKNTFIATQSPLENTVSDFWRMIVEQNCSIVVSLTTSHDTGKEFECFQYWPSLKPMRHHYYVIDPVHENCYANFTVREFKITDPRDDTSRKIRQYHYSKWPSFRAPLSTDSIIELIGHVKKASNQTENSGPIVVHGSTGGGRTGVYIGLSIALEALRTESVVDMYQIVKGLRYQRPCLVETYEQYEFCFQVIRDYLKSFDIV